MARGASGDLTDWVTRAADDAIRHAQQRHGEGPRGPRDHVRVGRQPVGPHPPGQPARVHHPTFVAEEIRRRGIAVRHPPQLGRLRPVPQGPGGGRPVVERAHRRLLSVSPRPVGVPRVVGRALQGRCAAPAEMGVEMEGRSPDRAPPRRHLHRAGPPRDPAPRRHRGGAREAPHEEGRAAESTSRAENEQEAEASRTRRRRGRRADGSGDLARFPTSPTFAGSAAATRSRSRRTTTRRPTCPTPAPRAVSAASRTSPPSTRASWSGRSTGRCAGPTRASSDFELGGLDHSTPGRRTRSARSW